MISIINGSTTNEFSRNTTTAPTNETRVHLTCNDVDLLRKLSLAFSFFGTLFLFYVVLSLTVYTYKKRLLMCRGPRYSSAKKSTMVLTIFTLCGAFFALIYVGVEIPLVAPQSDQFCNFHYRLKIVAFGLSAACVYVALWYRIFTVFYKNKMMKKNTSKVLQCINLSAMPLLSLMVIVNLVSFLSAPPYVSVGCGCTQLQSAEENVLNWALLVGCTATFQIILLFSFTYPLYLHRQKMLSRGLDRSSIIPVVKRAAIVAGVSVISDLLSFLGASIYDGPVLHLPHVIYGCNLLINLTGTILVFADWREKLFPFKKTSGSSPTTKHIAFTVQIKTVANEA